MSSINPDKKPSSLASQTLPENVVAPPISEIEEAFAKSIPSPEAVAPPVMSIELLQPDTAFDALLKSELILGVIASGDDITTRKSLSVNLNTFLKFLLVSNVNRTSFPQDGFCITLQ